MGRLRVAVLVVLVSLQVAQSAPTTPDPGCGTNPADIVFLLDSSGSVHLVNFNKQLDFVKKFIQSFNIGPRAVQIGVTTFSTHPHNEFWLNQHQNKGSLINAVSHIRYLSGNTHTDEALAFVRTQQFTKAHGDRDQVANILIVLTDGRSGNQHATALQAAEMHKTNVNVFAIGIGSGIGQTELKAIASNDKNVFTVSNFDALQTIQATLKKTACQIDGKWSIWGFYGPCSKTCEGGTKYRERTCSNPPPSHGGKNCVGSHHETMACGTKACTTTAPPTTITPKPVQHSTPTVAPGCGLQPVDIVFILDASGSVGTTNFQKMLTFVETMVQGFDVSPQGAQIGVITFDSKTYPQFHLNKYHDKTSVVNAIKAIRYTRGNTYTYLALKYVRDTSFTVANGARASAAKVAIVITDGKSQSPSATASEAQKLRNAGITVFSIGVGTGPKESELKAMASDPDSGHVFIVSNFDALKLIKGQLQTKTCEVKPTVHVVSPPTAKPNCGAQADIIFLLDESGSVGSANFQKMLDFAKDVAKDFVIGPNDVQVGVDTFSTTSHKQFDLNQHPTEASVISAVGNIKYLGGSTNTGGAIQFMMANSFTSAAGMRSGVPHIAIVVTDGRSQNKAVTKSEAQKARAAGVKIITVGVGSGVDNAELKDIASDPDNQYVYTAATFDALKSLKDLLASKACEVSKPKPNPQSTPPPNCGIKADIVFLLDSSGSVGSANFNLLLTFVKSLIQNFDVSRDHIRIGIEKFSSRPFLEFNLNKFATKQEVLNGINQIQYVSGNTNTGDALKYMKDNMFNPKNGDRPGVPNIGIVITDGKSNKPDLTKAQARIARNAGITLFSVGVGSGVSLPELNEIASDPDEDHVLTVNGFNKLQEIRALFTSKACNVIPPTLPPYIPPTAGTTQAPLIDPCRDAISNCDRYAPTVCTEFAQWANDNCRRFCGICTTSVPTIPPPCEDKLPNCKSYAPSSCLNQYATWAKENCRKYCGYCSLHTVTGYFGRCYYKGKEYKQGDKWQDGCSYDCECQDASKGQYACYNKCPAYYNLPPQCTLVAVKNECCLKPVCDFEGSYETTSGQNVGKLNGLNVCVYKGQKYYQGQTWQVGCESQCHCQDSSVGLWACQSICGSYGTLPTHCKLVQKPGECCTKPDCEFTTQYGSFTGKGTLSGQGDKGKLTTPPPCVDKQSNCKDYPSDMCTSFKPWALENCRKYCNLCAEYLQPKPTDVCIYKGTSYTQGQKWVDGCSGECTCENSKYGYYRCNDACPKYYNVPPGCTLAKIAGYCCELIKCAGGTFVGSQRQPGTIGGYPIPFPNPSQVPSPGPNSQIPTSAPFLVPQRLAGCMYKGTLYQQGQRWSDSCDYSCICEDGTQGRFQCSPRCPTFNNLATGCVLKDQPNDPCCQFPDCTAAPAGTVIVPHYGPGFTGYGPAVYPLGYGNGPSGTGLPPTLPSGVTQGPITGGRQGCLYKGHIYQQGQTWEDGCAYSCQCSDGTAGIYRCTEKCPRYQNLPPQCTLIPDPQNACCKTYRCDFTQRLTTQPPLFAVTTPQAGINYCVYKGTYHRQGESWSDGCSLTCRCEDARNNYHQCMDRCPSFTSMPLGCTLVPDPRDPQCCKIPECDSRQTGTVNSQYQPLGFIGSFTGYGRPPNSIVNSQTGYRNACIYKGQIYQQGVLWHDGCQFDCECTKAALGQYRCTDRCQRYAAFPAGCTLVQDPNDQCCQKASCAPTSGGTCVDKKSNCYLYGSYACQDPYIPWAKENCPRFCGFCGPKTTTNPANCKNKIPNCSDYGKDSCVGDYVAWAKYNCPQYCGYCNGGSGLATTKGSIVVIGGTSSTGTGTGSRNCNDVISNCAQYSQDACHDQYLTWAIANCPKHCRLCDRIIGGQVSGTGATAPSGTNHGSGVSSITQFPQQSFTGLNSGCYYKGRVYRQSEEWQDGCDYNCTCANGQTGYYTCRSLCKIYQFLPTNCRLVKASGACCGEPQCTGTAGSNFCVYKGQNYLEGSTWSDGCDFSCTCVDASRHYYQCRQKCISWTLPAACTLNPPAPGKCCKTPNCPSGYIINYPPGYVPE